METVEFKAWPKIQRIGAENICITEKMNGTNACIIIQDGEIVGVQSRRRIITPVDDNYGFACWVHNNEVELLGLGDGYHYGEWIGEGIQKNPHKAVGNHFYLFNTARWNADNPNRPGCCLVVPVLFIGKYTPNIIEETMESLAEREGYAEGVVVYYMATKTLYKSTFENSGGKWVRKPDTNTKEYIQGETT